MPCHLVVSGFHVIYFNSAELQVRLGRFDLRNVLLLQPLGGGADDCIKLTVREGAGKDKHIVLMFANEDKAEWRPDDPAHADEPPPPEETEEEEGEVRL